MHELVAWMAGEQGIAFLIGLTAGSWITTYVVRKHEGRWTNLGG
jgi:hypothetical protein